MNSPIYSLSAQRHVSGSALEAEAQVLGACLLDPDVEIDRVLAIPLRPEHFVDPTYRKVYEAICDLRGEDIFVNDLAIGDRLGWCTVVGRSNMEMLSNLQRDLIINYHSTQAAHLIIAAYRRSKLAEFAQDILRRIDASQGDHDPAQDQIRDAMAGIMTLAQEHEEEAQYDAKSIMAEVIEEIARRQDGEGSGITTGFSKLDEVAGDIGEDYLTLVGARPSMGKTAFACQVASSLAVDRNKPVLFFSLEMSRARILQRILAAKCGVSVVKMLRKRGLTPEHMASIAEWKPVIDGSPITVNDRPRMTVGDMAAYARIQHAKVGLSLIVVDYVQFIDYANSRAKGHEPTHEALNRVSRELKQMARTLKVPVMALAQLNRGAVSETGKVRKPRISDLKDSGSLEQNADQVILLHRPAYYDQDEPVQGQFIIGKNRDGATGIVEMDWNAELMLYIDQGERPVF